MTELQKLAEARAAAKVAMATAQKATRIATLAVWDARDDLKNADLALERYHKANPTGETECLS